MGFGIRGDFTGFTYGGIHSSELGITHISDGSRYVEELSPTLQNKTAQVNGADETFFFESAHTQKQFNIQFAFDNLDEVQLRKLKQVFSDKKLKKLIFDEEPYKYYMVKPVSAPNIQYICFDEFEGEPNMTQIQKAEGSPIIYFDSSNQSTIKRIYKGDGTLQVVAFYPYAHSVHKYLSEFINYSNKNEWGAASGMKTNGGNYDSFSEITSDENTTECRVYNAGDLPANFKLTIKNGEFKYITKIELLDSSETSIAYMTFKNMEDLVFGNDNQVIFDTRANVIATTGGILLTKYINEGNFFKIPVNLNGADNFIKVTFESTETMSKNDFEIEYEYLYY